MHCIIYEFEMVAAYFKHTTVPWHKIQPGHLIMYICLFLDML